MKLILVKRVDKKESEELSEIVEEISQLCTLIRLTMTDGSYLWLSQTNFSGSDCLCCPAFSEGEVKCIEGFTIEQ